MAVEAALQESTAESSYEQGQRADLPDHEEAREESDGREVEDGGEDSLHCGDDETAMNDELAQRCRTLVAVAAMNHQEAPQVAELCNGEVGSQRRLLSLLQEQHRSSHFRNIS